MVDEWEDNCNKTIQGNGRYILMVNKTIEDKFIRGRDRISCQKLHD